MSDKPLRLDMRLRNNRLIKARERLGYTSCAAAAKALGLPYPILVELESLKRNPVDERYGTWTESARRIADAYYTDPGELWPEGLSIIEKPRISAELEFAELMQLTAQEGSPDLELLAALKTAVDRLPPRLQKVLKHYSEDGLTLKEVGKAIEPLHVSLPQGLSKKEAKKRRAEGISQERARHLKNAAVSQLRRDLTHFLNWGRWPIRVEEKDVK